ncbi:MAG: hypothetical protein RDV48_14505 [Candidatus Eremiobacteraeota bacterium]|nr:hypothetical protein [Candidatus Eremiobacteraeota bacterium]
MLTIVLSHDKKNCRPGEKIEGTLQWDLPGTPGTLELRLCWHTAGKGTVDTRRVDTFEWKENSPKGSRSFSFPLPLMPYSFSGKLVSLRWFLEFLAPRVDDAKTGLHYFVLSPAGKELTLAGEAHEDAYEEIVEVWDEEEPRESP